MDVNESGRISLSFRPIGDVLYFEAVVLAPGTYTGIDGHTIEYTEEFIKKMYEQLDDKPIVKISHGTKKPVGYITGKALENGKLTCKGYIFDDDAIAEIYEKKLKAVSMEANVITTKNNGHEVAKDGQLEAVALVEQPACPQCIVKEIKEVALGMEEDELSVDALVAAAEKPEKKEFFEWIEKALKKAGVKDIEKAMKVIKDAIKVPYPYPYPQPAKLEVNWDVEENPYKKKYEELVKMQKEAEIAKLIDEIKSIDQTFDPKSIALQDYDAKKLFLQEFLRVLKERKPVKLAVDNVENRIDKICMELFGTKYRNLIPGGEGK